MSAAVSYRLHGAADAPAVAAWVGKYIEGGERGFGECTALSVWIDGELIAGVVFHNYCPESGVMEMTAAATSSRWMTRPVIRALHNYIFQDAGCQLAVTRVAAGNMHTRRIFERFGYVSHIVPRLRGRGEAEVIYTLADDAWKRSKFR